MFKQLLLLSLLCTFWVPVHAQPKLIFDTDHGGDSDDLGTLAMLHNLVKNGECELLAIMSWRTEQYVIAAMDAVNRFYGNPDIPMGIRHKNAHHLPRYYNKPIADALPHELTNDDVPLAVDLYRKVLSEQEDKSVTIVTVGPLKNIKNLLISEPDQYSDLPGKELIEQKVKEFVIMGGNYPWGRWEWNFDGRQPGVTKYVLEELTVPVVFSGWELGRQIRTGRRLNELDPGHPLYIGYKHWTMQSESRRARHGGEIVDNASWDQTAVLYAVRGGLGEYWDKVEGGYNVAKYENGANYWVAGEPTNHSYLVLKESPEKMAEIIYSIKLGDL
jgi:inosine-uridine nucleoside N-ribohydrolase